MHHVAGNDHTGVNHFPPHSIGTELEAVLHSDVFRHSRRSQDLLRHVVERCRNNEIDRLKERCIGADLFGRDPNYDTTHDAIVRVAANDLRKRLADYYRTCPDARIRIQLRAGSYVPEFETPEVATVSGPSPQRSSMQPILLALGILALLIAIFLRPASKAAPDPPWPISRVFDDHHRTIIVVADSNLGMIGVLRGRPVSLDEYLQPGVLGVDAPLDRSESDLRKIITSSRLTSYADVSTVFRIAQLAGRFSDRLETRFARDLHLADFQEGNFVLLGSPLTNPWVSVFAEQLNFREHVPSPEIREFINRNPSRGEKDKYQGFPWTGSAGEEYATISLLSTESHRGNVLILQGLHQEGTEAAGSIVATTEGHRKLRLALAVAGKDLPRTGFEVLIQSRAVVGVARSTEIIAARVLPQ